MKGFIFLQLMVLFLVDGYAQKDKKVMYIIDELPLTSQVNDDLGTLTEIDVFRIDTISNKDELKKAGYSKYTSIILVTTKKYNERDKDVRLIPSTRNLVYRNDKWFDKNNKLYSGSFRDYYLNGSNKMSGNLLNGVLDGLIDTYYPRGELKSSIIYINGKKDGEFKSFHINGFLKEKGTFLNGGKSGVYENYYSTGKLNYQQLYKGPVFVNNKYNPPITSDSAVSNLISKATIELTAHDVKVAIKILNDAEKIDSNKAEIFYFRAKAWIKDNQPDSAISDFDKAIKIEPLYEDALLNKALLIISKYDKGLKYENGDFVFRKKSIIKLPDDEAKIVCDILSKLFEIGDAREIVHKVISSYCS